MTDAIRKWQDCPSCGYRNAVSIQQGIGLDAFSSKISIPCINCERPLGEKGYLDGEPGNDEPKVKSLPPLWDDAHPYRQALKEEELRQTTKQPDIGIDALEQVVVRDVRDCIGDEPSEDQLRVVSIAVGSLVGALEALGIVPRGAIGEPKSSSA